MAGVSNVPRRDKYSGTRLPIRDGPGGPCENQNGTDGKRADLGDEEGRFAESPE